MNQDPQNYIHINPSFNDQGSIQNDFSYVTQPTYYNHYYDPSSMQNPHYSNNQNTNQQVTESNQNGRKEDIFNDSQAPYETRDDGGNKTNKKSKSKNVKTDASSFEASESKGLY